MTSFDQVQEALDHLRETVINLLYSPVTYAITPDKHGIDEDVVTDFTLKPGHSAWLTVDDVELQIFRRDGQLQVKAYRMDPDGNEGPELDALTVDLGGDYAGT